MSDAGKKKDYGFSDATHNSGEHVDQHDVEQQQGIGHAPVYGEDVPKDDAPSDESTHNADD